MSLLVSASNIEKTMGSNLLFSGLSFGINTDDKIGLIGRNGTGKSTLLKIIAGTEQTDQGELSVQRGLRIAYVEQDEKFDPSDSIGEVLTKFISGRTEQDPTEVMVQSGIALSLVGLDDPSSSVGSLSGGWRKRLSLAKAIALDPQLLILDEPTNHLDWEGILWLEGWLNKFKGALLLVSHDRQFINNCCSKTLEISPMYPDGYKLWDYAYFSFIEKRSEWMDQQLEQEKRLANKVRREIEWLRAGVKARTTKSQSRITEAHELIDKHSKIKQRNKAGSQRSKIEIERGEKRSKKLIELESVSISYADKVIVSEVNIKLGPNMCCAVLGDNGSGKSSLLNIIGRRADNYSGKIEWAEDLKIVYFDQKREDLPQEKSIVDFLGEGTEYVNFRNQSIHVASYASRFLFTSEKMRLAIGRLSGGEQARLLIAKLLLQPADLLILDEPTNDLDIESIEILEGSLQDFAGLTIVVSHDRRFIQQIASHYLALQGSGQVYADLNQWLKFRKGKLSSVTKPKAAKNPPSEKKKKKLSYKDKLKLETIEDDIQQAEAKYEKIQATLSTEEVLADHLELTRVTEELQLVRTQIDELYSEWDRLESLK